MQKKTIVIILAVLIVAAAVLAVVVSNSQPKTSASEIVIIQDGKQTKVDVSKLQLTDVKATVTRANGKTIEIDSKGIELSSLLENYSGYTSVRVAAEDSYSADLKAEEIAEAGNVYLILDGENKPRLVVLSDTDAKRDVKNVLSMELIK